MAVLSIWKLFFQPKWLNATYLLQFGKGKGVAVFGSELHEPHVCGVSQLGDDAEAGKQPANQGNMRVTPTGLRGTFTTRPNPYLEFRHEKCYSIS